MTESLYEQKVVRLLENIELLLRHINTSLMAVVVETEESVKEESSCCSENPGANAGCCPSNLS